MTDSTIRANVNPFASGDWLSHGLLALVCLAFLLKLHLLFLLNVNWDEFRYLSLVYTYLRGELTAPLQTFHVHFFTWLRHIPGHEIEQIIAARLVMFGFSLGSVILLYRIGRRYLDSAATCFAILCYLAFSFVIEHGTSFRADAIATFFCLFSIHMLLDSRPAWRAPLLAGFAFSVAVMVTIKSLIYLPIIGILYLLPVLASRGSWRHLAHGAAFALALVASFTVMLFWHKLSLGPVEVKNPAIMTAGAFEKVFAMDVLFPRRLSFVVSVAENAVIWATLVLGVVTLIREACSKRTAERHTAIVLLVLMLPLASLPIYRNAFAYYYVFILPFPILACGAMFASVLRMQPTKLFSSPKLLALGIALVIFVNFGKVYIAAAQPALELQRQTIALVHRLFPEPAAYIDRSEMISSFRKVGFFMSSWGMENYLEQSEAIFRDLVLRNRPLFLIANIRSLDPRVPPEQIRSTGGHALIDEDHAVLASNFVHHWGAIFVAGKTLTFRNGSESVEFEVLIPGLYTLESSTTLVINGQAVASGETLHLPRGRHSALTHGSKPHRAILRWGDRLYRPAEPPAPGPIFTGF